MADKENKDLTSKEVNKNTEMPNSPETPSMEEKLKEAAGNITKAHASHRERNSELVKRRLKAEKESKARIEEAEKRREATEKHAQQVAERKIAEFDYAQNYRKKLLKEREEAMAAAKQRKAEAREEAIREAKEARDQSVASYLEMERKEAQERSDRADALVTSVTKREIIDENGNKVLVDRFPQKPDDATPPTEEDGDMIPENVQPETVDEAQKVEEVSDPESAAENGEEADSPAMKNAEEQISEENAENDSQVPEEEPEAADEAQEAEATAEEPAAEEPENDGMIEMSFDEEEKTDDEDDSAFRMVFDDDGNLLIHHDDPEEEFDDAEDPDGSDGDSPDDGYSDDEESDEGEYDEYGDEYEKEEFSRIPDDLLVHGEIVRAIKSESARLEYADGVAFKSYVRHSFKALKSFEAARREGVRALDANREDREAPVILAGIIKICGKILEIRCNNLETFVRLQAYKYIDKARSALHDEIETYNDYAVTYSSLTGEQLTRISTFLPENIVKGKALSVIPDLFYKESYVQTYPEMLAKSDSTVIPVPAVLTADYLFGRYKAPTGRFTGAIHMLRAKHAVGRLERQCRKLESAVYKTKVLKKLYQSELKRLDMRTPESQRTSDRYRNKAFRITAKYGKRLTRMTTLKTKSAFAKEKRRLAVNRLALEREKLVVAYMLLRALYRVGKPGQRSEAERFFIKMMLAYNNQAEICSRLIGTPLAQIPSTIVEQVCRADDEIEFPIMAYKQELVEMVGENARIISTELKLELTPNEEGYAESSGKIMKTGSLYNSQSLSEDAVMSDRASAIAKVMIDSLRESADMVVTLDELGQFRAKSNRAIKYFRRALKASEKAISIAFDENGVVTALVENLRVIANLIEVCRINVAVAVKVNSTDAARSNSRALYKYIELYNGRAIDYMSIVGDQFSRISANTPKELLDEAGSLRVPVITYRDNYIEVFPKDPLKDTAYEKPVQRRSGVYTPLLMKHFRLTENRSVETTVVNAPFVFDVSIDDTPVKSWHHPVGFVEHLFVWAQPIDAWFKRLGANAEIWFIDESLLFSKEGLKGRYGRNERRIKAFERKLKLLKDKHRAELLKLESVIHETDRHTASYQRKLKRINTKYNRRIYNLKMRWTGSCAGRNKARILLERLVLERERLIGINKVLIKYRNYGRVTFTPNVLVRYKRKFIKIIDEHNKIANELAEIVGVKFSEISSTVADEIIRYGNMVKFPQIVCCREIIETIDGKPRTVGDRWHGYGLYTGATGTEAGANNSPVMAVGAMGYSTDMGVPYFKADFDGMTMLGMTAGGVPLIGFGKSGGAEIPFTGTPMMLAGEDYSPVLDAGRAGHDGPILGGVNATDPFSGINSAAVDARFVDELEEKTKDAMSGCTVETPLDIEAKMIEERFSRALRARSMTMVDGVKTWWKLVGSEINLGIMRWLTLRPQGFLRILLPPPDFYTEVINLKLDPEEAEALEQIAKVGILVDIECKRLYSAVKAGIRRSQRMWSLWLHADIEKYNELVREYNKKRKNRNEHIETLSLNIPDTIIHRLEDRPPVPPVFSLRNKVKISEDNKPVRLDEIYNKLYKFAVEGGLRHLEGLSRFITKYFTIPAIKRAYKKGKHAKVVRLVGKVVRRRFVATDRWRWDNEARHYRIRYEKARAMKRYNRRTLRAVGVATDPIKYQIKTSKVLRQYVKTNFRIDYNMRIRQLIYRALRISPKFYLKSSTIVVAILIVALLLATPAPYIQAIFAFAVFWVLLPIELLVAQLFYEVLLMIYSLLTVMTRNIWLVKYGARDVERNRYGAILECFVCEEYKILLACERVRIAYNKSLENFEKDPLKRKQPSIPDSMKRELIEMINDYNKLTDKYSKVLRIPIKKIETTYLLEKLTSGSDTAELTELQDFIYVRELVERTDPLKVGKTLPERELNDIYGEIQTIIDTLNASDAHNSEGFDRLKNAIQTLVNHIQNETNLNENERFELKRELVEAISGVEEHLTPEKIESFNRNVIKVVDQLGGRDMRKIIGILGRDNMVI